MTTAAQTIFDSLKSEADLQALIANREQEDDHLEFKIAPRLPGGDFDVDGIKAKYSKALSAFANAAGGVIVWGMACKPDPVTKIDKATKREPIQNVERLQTILNSNKARATDPAVIGVDNYVIKDANGVGYVVTLIPESIITPHMAAFGDPNRYFRRHGSESFPMKHNEVADMFGRRQVPKLEFFFRMYRSPGNTLINRSVRAVFGITNSGRAIAKFPMLEVMFNPEEWVKLCQGGNGDNDHEYGLKRVSTDKKGAYKFIGGSEKVIYSKQRLVIGYIQDIPEVCKSEDIYIDYSLAADGVPHEYHRTKFHHHSMQDVLKYGREIDTLIELDNLENG